MKLDAAGALYAFACSVPNDYRFDCSLFQSGKFITKEEGLIDAALIEQYGDGHAVSYIEGVPAVLSLYCAESSEDLLPCGEFLSSLMYEIDQWEREQDYREDIREGMMA